jgi:tartrate-resistant acid phosphatase type 5
MPSKWYTFDYPAQQPLVKFIVLDSNYHNRVRSLTTEEKAAQNEWLKAELAKPRTAPWLVLMAHHPLYTNGGHGDNAPLIADWSDLFKQHKVDFYFAGHDHDMQHLEFDEHPTSFVISGGGGARVGEIKELKYKPFAQGIYGFSQLQITAEQFLIRHIDANRNQLHAFTKTPTGKVTILT